MLTQPAPMLQALRNKKAAGFDITISILPTEDGGIDAQVKQPDMEMGMGMGEGEEEKEVKALGLAPDATKLGAESEEEDLEMTPELEGGELPPFDREAFGKNLTKGPGGLGKGSMAEKGMLKKK